VHGLSPIEAGNVLLIAVIAYQVGMLAFGPLDRLLDTRKWIAIASSLVIISILATLAWPFGAQKQTSRHRVLTVLPVPAQLATDSNC
jgi:hypothetical protein